MINSSMRLLLATHNPDKRSELRAILQQQFGDGVEILTLDDIEPTIGEIAESGATLEENALIKARAVFEHTGIATVADDTGLEVDALDGAPGVYSARYSGRDATYDSNIKKLLTELKGVAERTAKFSTVIAYYPNVNQAQLFRGEVLGSITGRRRGTNGFGYDPVFIPSGEKKTFAEMADTEKNAISHRGRAMEQFVRFLENEE